jgi:hypothetical protein
MITRKSRCGFSRWLYHCLETSWRDAPQCSRASCSRSRSGLSQGSNQCHYHLEQCRRGRRSIMQVETRAQA